jgi:hypothetical protein
MQQLIPVPIYIASPVVCIYTYTAMPRIFSKRRHVAASGAPSSSATTPPTHHPLPPLQSHHHHTIGTYTKSAASCETSWIRQHKRNLQPCFTTHATGYHCEPTSSKWDIHRPKCIAKLTVKHRRSKAIDMRFYWIQDRVKQGQFLVHWRRGADNLADYLLHNKASLTCSSIIA